MSASTSLSDLEPLLASLNEVKAPGANKSKIATITGICVKNIQAEQSIVQSFYRALKKAPATHKLGALYVIDSVIRQWTDKAKKAGQELHVDGRGEPGTYSAALKRVAELMPALLHDTLKVIPSEQKPRLLNLVDIWERGHFFPAKIFADFKQIVAEEAAAPPPNNENKKFRPALPTRPSHTPLGMPPQRLNDQGLLPASMERSTSVAKSAKSPSAPPQQQDVTGILAALAMSAPKPIVHQPPPLPQPTAVPMPPPVPQAVPPEFLAMLAAQQPQQPPPALAPPFGMPQMPAAPAFNPAMQLPAFQPAMPQFAPQPAADPLGPLRSILPENIINDHKKLMQALNLLNELQSGGIPMDQWGPVIQAFTEQTEQRSAAPPTDTARGRSRSPDRRVRGRGSPVYGSYEDPTAERAKYRQRSPHARGSPSINGAMAWNGMPMQPKIIEVDHSLPPNNIKVLSRTLFVGGANGSQAEIQTLFERFGRVQTCIANRDKRHAFVKMTTRQAALIAKAAMEDMQQKNDRDVMNVARQTKWGVGFGPRECCDYQRGESVIPIHKLTDADVKWLLTAEYGGTGGKELHGGMVLEEPDIEIGAGVSSKAMSKRVGPDATQQQNAGGRRRRGHDKAHRGGGQQDAQVGGMPPMETYQ